MNISRESYTCHIILVFGNPCDILPVNVPYTLVECILKILKRPERIVVSNFHWLWFRHFGNYVKDVTRKHEKVAVGRK